MWRSVLLWSLAGLLALLLSVAGIYVTVGLAFADPGRLALPGDLASRLRADYSADPVAFVALRPLSTTVVEEAVRERQKQQTPSPEKPRATPAVRPSRTVPPRPALTKSPTPRGTGTATSTVGPSPSPTSTSMASPSPSPSGTVRPTGTGTARPTATATPPAPTDTPAPPPPPTNTRPPRPTDTPPPPPTNTPAPPPTEPPYPPPPPPTAYPLVVDRRPSDPALPAGLVALGAVLLGVLTCVRPQRSQR